MRMAADAFAYTFIIKVEIKKEEKREHLVMKTVAGHLMKEN